VDDDDHNGEARIITGGSWELLLLLTLEVSAQALVASFKRYT